MRGVKIFIFICIVLGGQIVANEHQKPKNIVIAGGMWPLPSLIMLLEGGTSSLTYIPKASKNALKASFMYELFPEIAALASGENENIEELLKLKPDLFICHSANLKLCQQMKKTHIPTIEMSVNTWDYNSYETLQGWLEVIAPILGKESRARAFLRFTKSVEEDIAKEVATQESKPRAMIIHFAESEKSFMCGGIFADYLLEKSGAENVIESKSIAKVSLEEIYRLNPDIIYINNFNTLMPEDILNSPLWGVVKAVQDKRVYKFPLGSYRPFAPSLDLPILLTWLYTHNHPKSSKDINLINFAQNFYKQYFDISLSFEQARGIFNPKKEAGLVK
ncbi:ABC transporter substrate-binding protein [Helicobacter marmotae]|uniref:Fe/B12 periplasmic-binding domain-containing protein n=1 Tax=Helicobacter marmotae TaxID=152490 RepID=A0A3D8I754_9HELI|nr:ABC transporter substrate-binding protein [Helicobacter marmotae]RDU61010.1 hypothetical protein CQA63_00430 [Helicobacter marmotae]